eukprot:3700614-Rhodomonas_salina.1
MHGAATVLPQHRFLYRHPGSPTLYIRTVTGHGIADPYGDTGIHYLSARSQFRTHRCVSNSLVAAEPRSVPETSHDAKSSANNHFFSTFCTRHVVNRI